MADNTQSQAAQVTDDNEVVVSIRDLHKTYDGETVILKGIDLDVHRGEVVVVLGPSGSGKSTMLRCVNLLETPTSGQIVFEGQDITAKGVDINAVRQKLGMVFQQFNLFPHLSVKKNVMIAQEKVLKRSPEEAERVAVEELTKVGLAERIDFMPSQLSGGQQQRVAIARALAMNPHVMLFDEATSALDPELATSRTASCSWTAASSWSRARPRRSSTIPRASAPRSSSATSRMCRDQRGRVRLVPLWSHAQGAPKEPVPFGAPGARW